MTQHLHSTFVKGCYRCDLNLDEMTADVNVTEKMARAANPGAFFPWSKPHERDHEIARAERALGVLADPDVLAGIAQVHHDFHHPRTCRGGCAGVDEVDEEFAAAVVELLKGGE